MQILGASAQDTCGQGVVFHEGGGAIALAPEGRRWNSFYLALLLLMLFLAGLLVGVCLACRCCRRAFANPEAEKANAEAETKKKGKEQEKRYLVVKALVYGLTVGELQVACRDYGFSPGSGATKECMARAILAENDIEVDYWQMGRGSRVPRVRRLGEGGLILAGSPGLLSLHAWRQ